MSTIGVPRPITTSAVPRALLKDVKMGDGVGGGMAVGSEGDVGVARVAGDVVMAHTFSTSGRPSRPEGMKISTMARIEKAATSL